MLDTSGWRQLELDVLKALRLDPHNVRLEVAGARIEADIMEDLFANEDVLGLVDGICKVGYLTHEIPVVVERKGSFVMVEGNRRLAALKAIQNPQLVPEYRARISALTKQIADRSTLSSVRVMVAPGEVQAEQLVAAIHTSNLRRRWTPARQAAFFQAQIDSGRKLKTLLARYPTIDVRRFVFRAHVLNAFKAVKFKKPELTDFLETKAWHRGLSALARIYESKEFMELTGFAMDDNGTVTKSVSDEVFAQMATVIVQGMLDGDLNTRSLNTVKSPRFLLLMTELKTIAGKTGEASSSASAGKAGRSTSSAAASGGAATKGDTDKTRRRTRRKQYYLDLGQISVPETYPVALAQHFAELSGLDVQRFPNATFLLMRATLEKSIKAYAEAVGEDIKKSGHNDNGRVQLGHCLKWLLQYVSAKGPRSLIQPISRVRDGKLAYAASSDSMNAVNHNHQFFVDPDEAFFLWLSIEPIIRHVTRP